MYRRLAAQRCTCELTAAVRDYLVHVHVKLRSAAGHPDMERKHIVVLTREYLVADLDNQTVLFLGEAPARKVGVSGRFLQNCIGGDHLAGNEVLPDAEVFERTLGLRTP